MPSAAKRKARAAWYHDVGDGSCPALQHAPWWRHVHRDFRRHQATGETPWRTLLLSQGFWASTVYRLSRAALRAARPGPLKALVGGVALVAQKGVEITTGISIPPACEVGEGLYIGHFGTIIFAVSARIGHNCSVAQNVTVGPAVSGEARGAPVIGDRVFIGAHSVITGGITVGDDAMICAGSVVTRPVPPRALVMGNPARVISYEGSFEYVHYDGMHADPARRASLDAASR